MGGFFKSKKPSVEEHIMQLPEYQKVRQGVSGRLSENLNKAAPQYEGNRVAGLNTAQQGALNRINQWGQNTPQVIGNATNMVNNMMTGGFDPNTSQWYQGMRGAMQENLANTLSSIANKAAGGGRYWSGARLQQQGKAATNMANSLNQNLGRLAMQERQMAVNALPYAGQLANYPYQQQMNVMQANEAERGLEQQRLSTAFEDWYRRNYQYPQQQIQNALQFVQNEPVKMDTIVHQGKSSPFSRIAGTAAGLALGGPLGATAYNALGGLVGGWRKNKEEE